MNIQEKHMKKNIGTILTVFITLGLSALALLLGGVQLNGLQSDTLQTLIIICVISIAYCFIVGEITGNNSQMDKLWSILPIVYAWIIAVKSGMNLRLTVMAILITIWGVRLTLNFAKKGAYSLKFWSGEEEIGRASCRERV